MNKKRNLITENSLLLEMGLFTVVILLVLVFFAPFDLNGGFGQFSLRQDAQKTFAQRGDSNAKGILLDDSTLKIETLGKGYLVTIKDKDIDSARKKAQDWFGQNRPGNICDLKISFVPDKGLDVHFGAKDSVPDSCPVPDRPKPPANVDPNRKPNPQKR